MKFLNTVTSAFNMYQRNIKPRRKPTQKKKGGEAKILRRWILLIQNKRDLAVEKRKKTTLG